MRSFTDRNTLVNTITILFLVVSVTTLAVAQLPHSAITADHRITPEDLVKILQSKDLQPLILSVGPRLLFAQAHIKGAELIGPASDPTNLEALKNRVKSLPKNSAIVLYCGCCPWEHCPNVEPAFKLLGSLGFSKVQVLYLANNFGTDWVDKGYPTVRQ